MKKLLSISLLILLFLSFIGFQLSVEICCHEGLVLHFGVEQPCEDDCCADQESDECCPKETLQKDANLLTFTSQDRCEMPQLSAASNALVFQNVIETALAPRCSFNLHINSPPQRILNGAFRC